MALSGTTLTVTTLTTAGLLTNNVSGQVSSVTGSSLASLLGGAPTFTGLTLSGLTSTMLKTNSSGGVTAAVANTDYQGVMSNGTNISITGGSVINVITNPSFSGLTLSAVGLANTMLKTVAGVISAATVNNDYQGVMSSGSNISITSGTLINVVSNPTFAGINCSSIGTNNTLLGTNAGALLSTSGVGSNVLCGYQAGSNITSGTYNTCIGTNAVSSSATVTNELVISNTSSSVTGKGTNTAFINAPSGLFSYSPAYCMLYSTAFNNGNVTWAFWNDGTTTYNNGFTLYNSNTLVVQPFNGLYEITFSGTAVCASNLTRINLNVNNIRVYDVSYDSNAAMSGYAVSINGSTLSRPYALIGGVYTGWTVAMINSSYWRAENPLFMMIKFVSL